MIPNTAPKMLKSNFEAPPVFSVIYFFLTSLVAFATRRAFIIITRHLLVVLDRFPNKVDRNVYDQSSVHIFQGAFAFHSIR